MTIVVMTGGTSGFGALTVDALRRLDVDVVLGARRPIPGAIGLELSSLASVRRFADSVRTYLGEQRIDALILNAGMILSDDAARTEDGYEATFAVNHLAHYLLIELLRPELADGARIVATTSGAHDPALRTGLEPPRHACADLLAHPERDPGRSSTPRRAAQHAYTASRLCNVLTVRSLRADPDIVRRRISVVAFDPGQVFGTGLARDLSLPRRVGWSVLGTAFGAPVRRMNPTMNTRRAAGNSLSDLVVGPIPDDGYYAALRGGRLIWTEPSELARSDDVAAELWTASASLVGSDPSRQRQEQVGHDRS